MNPRNFFAELKRRNVYKVAVAYPVVGWLHTGATAEAVAIFRRQLAVSAGHVSIARLNRSRLGPDPQRSRLSGIAAGNELVGPGK